MMKVFVPIDVSAVGVTFAALFASGFVSGLAFVWIINIIARHV